MPTVRLPFHDARMLGLCLLVVAMGCQFGPKAIERTHWGYSESIQKVDEEQFLHNVVRLRYYENARNLDVSSIASQYELAGGAEMRPFFATETGDPAIFRTFESLLPFAAISGANRPTVSMVPQDDAAVVRQFLTPIPADTLIFLGQSGWPVSTILRIWVDRLNGIPNHVAGGPQRRRVADFERFNRIAALMQSSQENEEASIAVVERILERSGPLPADSITPAAAVEAAKNGLELQPREDGKHWSLIRREKRTVLRIHSHGMRSPNVAEFVNLLNLLPGLPEYDAKIESGIPDPQKNATPPNNSLRITTRSTAEALFYLASGVEVPSEHVESGLVQVESSGCEPATHGIFRVRARKGHRWHRPKDAYLAIWYRDHWFTIDDTDIESKATLLLMLQLRRLDFKRQSAEGIALTLPVGR
ncbi:hypothetical protein [Tuwongella immobilis]|uniref:Uncharacterized protein n=1 Tax=Tuwongella immobilis TaxID=692036 RepID=A0A6C2YMR2_9BACT|nr:hypothetical protein [Tuwongella immobilis]VIP02657.1 Uncharacterized protein OS=Singulisphaera acidiphila (strain ATCC BAA-1392 / DSM 18658 / VKM B-2454 / MOB10) GN=Sinac_6171 PE=4 SV=1 [Tuwongella immobilis]VTS02060.1 Uncharacterized protein OS=Singulisphaera acidiphila (strain ATCC BAA-1392 / DSM 18658 / VKM B-2454 / MOB10) GN=Sinac_6171 PE=4 SV=1 [Tuwongella immobilis]